MKKIIYPFGPKILTSYCPETILKKLNDIIDEDLNNNDFKKNFSSSYKLIPNLLNRDLENVFLSEQICIKIGLKNFLEELANFYIEDEINFQNKKLKLSIIEKNNNNFKNKNITYSDCWINRYFFGDYTQIHTHGGILSGVIFLKFPQDEKNNFYSDENVSDHGKLTFFYGSEQNFCSDIWIPNKKVGKVIIFPSWLKHTVYSNKSKYERRSLSFNLITEENYYERKNYNQKLL